MQKHRDHLPAVSPALQRLFIRYLRRYFGRHFDAVRISKQSCRPGDLAGSFVVFSNHPSWWDPIVYMVLSGALLPGWEGYGPMDAEALEKYPFFRRLGIFPLERGTHRGAVRFLRTAETVLRRPKAVLWMTAEGGFTDPRRRPIELQFGVAHLARRMPRLVALPLAIEYPFWNERLPEVLVRFGDPVDLAGCDLRQLDAAKRRFEAALTETMDALAAEAQARDPELFDTLILGRAGIGGPYDAWRRSKAALRGRSAVLSHDEDRR